MPNTHRIYKTFHEIPFAHRQWTHPGHCALIHGHSWSIKVTFAADALDKNGFVYDFGQMSSLKSFIAQNLDHALVLAQDDPELAVLRQIPAKLFLVKSPSAEGIAEHLYTVFNQLVKVDTNGRVRVTAVEVFEDSKNSAVYY